MQIEVNYQTKKDAADPNPQNRVFRVHFFVAPSMPQRAQIIKGLSQLGIDFDENSISFYASNRTDVKTTKLNWIVHDINGTRKHVNEGLIRQIETMIETVSAAAGVLRALYGEVTGPGFLKAIGR